ncbi:putative 14-3-3-like protein [Rosellinia necatrix]|uniref:Putative 14-3-3-like protein n=1 Tax=Rosellinia necatrix TaxID=77044 RepID=A0A1W2TLE1_ROSNE|nr:putative 14-3-3-like protein [Rosellinia necatrix]
MASSEVDQKFLGKLAKEVEPNNAALASMLFKILGLSINLAEHTAKARKQRRLDTWRGTQSLDLYFRIIWLAREGLIMLEQYILPMVGDHGELKVLAFKLRASFYHIFVLFHNSPSVSIMGINVPISGAPPIPRLDKGKGIESDHRSSVQPTHPLENPISPPPGFGPKGPEPPGAFLLPSVDYRPTARECFKQAVALADSLLWGSHSLRLSVKTEYASFLYECLHDHEGSRKLARDTVAEVYDASEGMDDDMFRDACELVTVLGQMARRGMEPTDTFDHSGRSTTPPLADLRADTNTRRLPAAASGTGMMDNFI